MKTTHTSQHNETDSNPSNQQFVKKLVRRYTDLFRNLGKAGKAYRSTNFEHTSSDFQLADLQQQVNELSQTLLALKDSLAGPKRHKMGAHQHSKKAASQNEIGLKRFRALQAAGA
ncbi:hypothetical protein GCM10028807_38320 [Spirosoma daeguense]